MFYVTFDGHLGCGKSTVMKEVEKQLAEQHFKVKSIDEHCMLNHSIIRHNFYPEMLYEKRVSKYNELMGLYDICLVENSFISNIVYQLGTASQELVDQYINMELEHYTNNWDTLQSYIIYRDYTQKECDMFLTLSHYLLENYKIDTNSIANANDNKLQENVEKIIKRIIWEIE